LKTPIQVTDPIYADAIGFERVLSFQKLTMPLKKLKNLSIIIEF